MKTLEIYRLDDLVGHLFHVDGEFVFQYVQDYKGAPLFAFPEIREYRSKNLWAFFAIRIPPLDRADMQREMARHFLRKDQTIEILGLIANTSISNPYEFRLSARPCQ